MVLQELVGQVAAVLAMAAQEEADLVVEVLAAVDTVDRVGVMAGLVVDMVGRAGEMDPAAAGPAAKKARDLVVLPVGQDRDTIRDTFRQLAAAGSLGRADLVGAAAVRQQEAQRALGKGPEHRVTQGLGISSVEAIVRAALLCRRMPEVSG